MTAPSREDILKSVAEALHSAAAGSEIVTASTAGDDLFTAAFAPIIADWVGRTAADAASYAAESETLAAEALTQMVRGRE